MHLSLETEQEEDGRWLSEIPNLPGVLVYGATRAEAISSVQALAERVIAERIVHGECIGKRHESLAVTGRK